MQSLKILFVYRTARNNIYNDWKKGVGPDSKLFGANHLINSGYKIDFFDWGYFPINPLHPLFFPLENAIISKIGMGFKLDQASVLLPITRNYDIIVCTGDSAGLPFLALKYFGLLNKPIVFMTSGLAGALKNKTKTWIGKFYRKILSSADIFTSYSQVEIDFFEKEMGIKKGKIEHVPLCTDFKYFSKKAKLKREIISSVGTELGRDYKTFFEAVSGLNIKAEIACHPDNIRGLKIPQNVKVHLNIPVGQVRRIYQRSLITVIPCVERHRSSGQMVLLEAASANIPIVASSIEGITGAFEFEEKKHLIYSKPQDVPELERNIKLLLKEQKSAQKMANNASKFIQSKYTTHNLAQRLEKFIDNL